MLLIAASAAAHVLYVMNAQPGGRDGSKADPDKGNGSNGDTGQSERDVWWRVAVC
jgi:hypothetical protein